MEKWRKSEGQEGEGVTDGEEEGVAPCGTQVKSLAHETRVLMANFFFFFGVEVKHHARIIVLHKPPEMVENVVNKVTDYVR